MRILLLLLTAVSFSTSSQEKAEWVPELTEKWEPEPAKVDPGETFSAPPSDAIVLFDGSGLDQWESVNGGEAKWSIEDGIVTVNPGTGNIQTRENFGDIQLHLEFRSPKGDVDKGQDKGNSGVFLQGRYEVQVLDSYNNRTYSNGQASSVYKQHIPLVNASKKPGEWQTYDIIYKQPVFDEEGNLLYPARVTVIHNGVLVQNNVAIQGNTEYIGLPEYSSHGEAPLQLQDHTDLVSYRNIWVRRL